MNNLSSYCGLVDAKIRASGKDLPVLRKYLFIPTYRLCAKSTQRRETCKITVEKEMAFQNAKALVKK